MNKETNPAPAEKHTYDGGITNENINKWKAQHRKVTRIDVEDDGDLHVGYFKRPSMETMAAVNKLAKTDEMRSAQTLFDGCWLGGSEDLRHDAVLFTACMGQLNVAFASVSASLKNL